jgi:carbonic anhydrase/acetyltransferase-like protein (isoleucine patch superfamily)
MLPGRIGALGFKLDDVSMVAGTDDRHDARLKDSPGDVWLKGGEQRTVLDMLRSAYAERDRELHQKFDRHLPFQDAIFDRWERAKSLGFEEGANIYHSAVVLGSVKAGRGTWIGPYVMLDGSGGGITIGAYCAISTGVHIYTHEAVQWSLTGGEIKPTRAPVSIGDHTYIGSQAIIDMGVRIGSRSVICANSFVNSNVANNTIVGGSPARVLGRVRFMDGKPILDFNARPRPRPVTPRPKALNQTLPRYR